MGTQDNLYDRIMRKPTAKDIMPKEIKSFLMHHGFVLKRISGSHHTYGFPEYPNIITIPIHEGKPIGPAYIDLVRKAIKEMEEET